VTSSQLLVVVLASFAGALVKSVTGMGYPVIAVPLISLVLGIEEAVVIVALPNFGANAFLWWEARDAQRETRDLRVLVAFGVVGAVVGTIALVNVPEAPLLIALAGMIVVFVVVFVRHPELEIDDRTARRGAPIVGTLVGLAQGAVGVSGPVVATWIHGYRLVPRAYVRSVTLIFGVTGLAQIAVLLTQGAFSGDLLAASAIAAVPVVVATPLGLRLRKALAGPAFEKVVLVVLSASAVSLLVDALT
jgi:uncharacterized membrane protein YfcA